MSCRDHICCAICTERDFILCWDHHHIGAAFILLRTLDCTMYVLSHLALRTVRDTCCINVALVSLTVYCLPVEPLFPADVFAKLLAAPSDTQNTKLRCISEEALPCPTVGGRSFNQQRQAPESTQRVAKNVLIFALVYTLDASQTWNLERCPPPSLSLFSISLSSLSLSLDSLAAEEAACQRRETQQQRAARKKAKGTQSSLGISRTAQWRTLPKKAPAGLTKRKHTNQKREHHHGHQGRPGGQARRGPGQTEGRLRMAPLPEYINLLLLLPRAR